jgi:F0F1-type ATP synthase membrane subunit b/b'
MREVLEIIGVATLIGFSVVATTKLIGSTKETKAQERQRVRENAEKELREAESRFNEAKEALENARKHMEAVSDKIIETADTKVEESIDSDID